MQFLTQLSRRERIIFYLCIIVIVSAVFYTLVVEKIIISWKKLDLKIARAEKELFKNYRLIRRKEDIYTEYEKYISYMKVKEGIEEKSSSILMEIENLARRNNVTTTDIKPLGAKDVDFYKKYVFEVSAEGDIRALTKFIYDMQASPKILTVEYLSLSAKNSGGGILHAEMRIAHASVKKLLPSLDF